MSNSLRTNPVYIDTLTTAVDLSTYFPSGEMILDSIEWSRPTGTSYFAVILAGGSTGVTVFREYCTVPNQSIIKYFHDAPVAPLYIPAAGTSMNADGHFIITVKR